VIPRLQNGRIVLRAWHDRDLEGIAAASRDPEVVRWTRVPEQNTAADVRAFRADQAPWLLSGRYAAWVVAEDDGPPLGVIDLRFEPEGDRASIGYWLGAAGRGRGLMTAAVRLVTRWALEERGAARVEIHVATGNAASQRVAGRAGFTREGVLRSYQELKGERQDHVVFSRLPGEPDRPAG
jgi:RimJ/RimL family protein N-acetyltransferase